MEVEVADVDSARAPEEVINKDIELLSTCRRSQRRRRLSGVFAPQAAEPLPEPVVAPKRRCNLKPKKNLETIADLENFYRNAKYKPPTLKNLETVYEEPVLKKGELVYLGPVKPRRFIFNGKVTKEKLRKRKSKAKNINVPKKKRISMDTFLKRLHKCKATDPGISTTDILANLLTSCQLTASTSQ